MPLSVINSPNHINKTQPAATDTREASIVTVESSPMAPCLWNKFSMA